jgi:aminodeoxychorismate synthase component I
VLRERLFPWLLDSAQCDDRLGRFSFAGTDPYLVATVRGEVCELDCRRPVRPGIALGRHSFRGDPFEVISRLLPRFELVAQGELPDLPFLGGAVGYFGYELAAQLEDVVEFAPDDDLGFPDLTLLFVDRLIAFDHMRGRACVIGLGLDRDEARARSTAELAAQDVHAVLDRALRGSRIAGVADAPAPERDAALRKRVLATRPPAAASQSVSRADYLAGVHRIKEEIARGNVYEANLTQRMAVPFGGDALDLYGALRRANPAPFGAYMELPSGAVLSSSPERFVRASAAGDVECRPIKGTRPRGSTPEEDDALQNDLAGSEKDRAENLMIVDLVRNDLGRVCENGSVRVPELMVVERYASVFQLVSTVTGRLRADRSAFDLIRACFPPGSMTGAPKLAAMRLLDRLEPVRRGVYSGALGYLDLRGGLDLSVVIRTLLVKKGYAYLHVGGAVVTDSDPAGEYDESIVKARAMLAALADVEVDPVGDAEPIG